MLSGLAVVPIIGALAVAGKLGRWGDTIVAVANKAAADPVFRATVEPALRRIQSGIANDGIGFLNVLASGGALQAAVDAEQAAAMQSLFGMDKAATQSQKSADALREASKTDAIPSISYKNAAQQGGANMVTAAELATGAKAVYGVGKWVVKNAPELLAKRGDDVVAKRTDAVAETAKPIVRQLDHFDTLAANAKIDMPHISDRPTNDGGTYLHIHNVTITHLRSHRDAYVRLAKIGRYCSAPVQRRSKERLLRFCVNICRRSDIIAC